MTQATPSQRASAWLSSFGAALALHDADATAAVLPHLLQAYGITTADQLASQCDSICNVAIMRNCKSAAI